MLLPLLLHLWPKGTGNVTRPRVFLVHTSRNVLLNNEIEENDESTLRHTLPRTDQCFHLDSICSNAASEMMSLSFLRMS